MNISHNFLQASSKGKASVGKTGPVPDAGWKEVVRKSKKVSVPSNAISRVIGRGGSNINAIRELSGAHIEVEKQSKGQGDRTILIKGSAEATRLANTWISAIIASPDKDLADIVGRQQYKTLSSVNLAKGGSSSSTVVVTKTVVKTVLTTTGAQGVQKSKSAQSVQKASAAVTAVTATSTKMTVTYSSAITTKTKPVTSTSFAAIAAGQENFGMIPTGPPPASALKSGAGKAMPPVKDKDALAGRRKETEGSTAPPPLMPPTSQGVDSKDYSPFKTFKMPGGGFVNWGAEKSESGAPVGQGFKGFATNSAIAVSQATISPAAAEDLAKAPGYRQQQQQQQLNSGSPSSIAASNVTPGWQGGSSQQPSTSLAPGYKKQVVTTVVTMVTTTTAEVATSQQRGGIFPTQERCNSAPGTPVSPMVTPSPIAPPPAPTTSKPNVTTSSPGSEPDWFARPGGGALGHGLRSMTPDGDLDRGWGGLREDLGAGCQQARQGTGSYGHNSPAKAPGAPIPELFGRKLEGGGMQEQNLLTAAAQLSNLGGGGYGDLLTSTATSLGQPSIPLPDPSSALPLSSSFSAFGRFGAVANSGGPGGALGPQPRFTSPGVPNTTGLVFSQPPTMSVPSAGLPKGLNPNAPDFNRGGMYNQIRGGPRQGLPPQQQKIPGAPGSSGFGYNNFGINSSFQAPQQQANSQNILINQGINAYLSSINAIGGGMGPTPPVMGDMGMSGLAGLSDLSLGGRTLSELQDMLGPEAVPGYNPSSMDSISGEMSGMSIGSSLGSLRTTGPIGRPIGAERQRLGPSPLGAGMGPQARKVDPFGVWDLPPSYSGDMSTNLTSSANSNTDSNFSLLPPSLSGQTLQSALDNLSKGSFSDLQYNGGSGGAPGSALDPGSIGGQTPGFGLSPSITPSKVIFVQYSSLFYSPFLFRWITVTGELEAQAAALLEAAARQQRQDTRIHSGPAARMLFAETFR